MCCGNGWDNGSAWNYLYEGRQQPAVNLATPRVPGLPELPKVLATPVAAAVVATDSVTTYRPMGWFERTLYGLGFLH